MKDFLFLVKTLTMKRLLFLAIFLFQVSTSFSQVSISNLTLKNRDTVYGFVETAYCFQDTVLVEIDTSNATGLTYTTFIYAIDNSGNHKSLLYSHTDSSGLFSTDTLQYEFNTIKGGSREPLLKVGVKVSSDQSSDTASILIINRNLPKVDSAYIQILGARVFGQPNKVSASSGAPGPWVGPNVVLPNIFFEHGYYDFFEVKLDRFDTTGHFRNRIRFEEPFDRVVNLDSNLRRFDQFNVAGRLQDTIDRFEYNTKRESYKFTFCYGVTGCGMDSVEIYFRTITKAEVGLPEDSSILELEVYPNPAEDHFSLSGHKNFEEIELLNLNGKVVKRFGADQLHSGEFNISDVPLGAYILKVKIGHQVISRRLIKR